ncbi:winged helix-turn-helix domain-containing protein [Salipaludibacillus aurantiacus]|uniref:Transcriptional regulatory protein, C terminal n=1 Tax=Salipaludibacillus aurantiacus TaxID=1601833 RepID=A0A1H9UTI6_9BACI|nr:winged helix-turn-helix domain-containing protein [Salipaludibacillus aurantiacus]SES12377.1 Transcriptional regulatory protein, C terminal [Salipaludibacillus aurantiacus]
MALHFDHSEYRVSFKGDSVSLLRREYELLSFLYENPGRAFSREELLDAVWKLEAPGDRTVDDHIYRLRRKLKSWNTYLTIKTVKGYGYSLNVTPTEETPSPLKNDREFKEITTHLLNKYHLYGHGEAFKTILDQKSLGIEPGRNTKVIYSLIEGDLLKLAQSREVAFSEKLLFMLYSYMLVANERKDVLPYYEKALEKTLFCEASNAEATILAPVFFYLFAEDFSAAAAHLKKADRLVTSENHGFYPFLQLSRMMLFICLKEQEKVNSVINKMESFFKEREYQRELGIFVVLKGVFALQSGDRAKGREYIAEGMRVTVNTRFMSHVYFANDICLFFLEKIVSDEQLYKEMLKEKAFFSEKFNFSAFKTEVERQFKQHL